MNEAKLLELIKRFVEKHETQRAAASALGISPQYLSDILSARRPPTDSVLAAIRIERVTTYRKAKLTAVV